MLELQLLILLIVGSHLLIQLGLLFVLTTLCLPRLLKVLLQVFLFSCVASFLFVELVQNVGGHCVDMQLGLTDHAH